MTPKQKIFIKEYLIDLNATRAAISAGYSERTACEQGSRLLANVKVKTEIERSLTKRAEKLDISAEKVLGELSKMAFANMQDYITIRDGDAYVDLSKLTRDQAAAIQEVTTDSYTVEGENEESAKVITKCKFKLADKRGSLELLGRYLKLFTDKFEAGGPNGEGLRIVIEHIGRTADSTPAQTV